MSVINESDLVIYDNFTKYENTKAKFNTKIASDMKHNGEIVDVLGFLKGKDSFNDRYVVRFNDDTIDNNIMTIELDFDYVKDPVQEDCRRILSKIIKLFDLNDKEIEELQIAVINFDYEANEGVVFLNTESIERLFTDEDCTVRIEPSLKQLKAIAEYMRQTEKYYSLYGYKEYTEKAINSILSKDENDISRLELLNEFKDMIANNILCYSKDITITKPKGNFEEDFIRENKKLKLIDLMINEEKQKENKKNKNRKCR